MAADVLQSRGPCLVRPSLCVSEAGEGICHAGLDVFMAPQELLGALDKGLHVPRARPAMLQHLLSSS